MLAKSAVKKTGRSRRTNINQPIEAAVVFYSMTTSTPEDAPRGMEFLYRLNRLNVAVSRAKCVGAIVGSPALFQVECKTPRQIQLANALCRYLETSAQFLAGTIQWG